MTNKNDPTITLKCCAWDWLGVLFLGDVILASAVKGMGLCHTVLAVFAGSNPAGPTQMEAGLRGNPKSHGAGSSTYPQSSQALSHLHGPWSFSFSGSEAKLSPSSGS